MRQPRLDDGAGGTGQPHLAGAERRPEEEAEVLDVVGALPLIGGFAIFLVAVAGLVMSGESIDFSTLIAYAIIVLLIGKLLRRGIHGFEKLGVMMIVLLMVFLVLL